MKLNDIVQEATLEKFIIVDEDIVAEYGDELEFYSYPDVAIESLIFIEENDVNYDETVDILKLIILNSNGTPVITSGYKMPNRVMLAAYNLMKQALLEV
jgi:hypothetical protein